jgi:3,4-dihydroxy 2-butanone 4-phosphate synthase/GTP cyclohydrolase II
LSGQSHRYSEADLPTPWGRFRIVVYHFGGEEALALVHGDPTGREDVLARVHSECLTGEVFGSQRCDCRAQLEQALERISTEEAGVLVYLRQEGRGIGLGNKVRAYALQDEGHDTVEANLALGFAPDLRSYEIAAAILSDLGVVSVRLLTNNPEKIEGLRKAGLVVVEQVPHWVESSGLSHDYLEVKRAKLGHVGATLADASATSGPAAVSTGAPARPVASPLTSAGAATNKNSQKATTTTTRTASRETKTRR